MKALRSYWPVVVFLISSIAHTDIIIVARPVIQRRLDVSLAAFALGVVIFSTMQLLFEYWFYGWCKSVAINDIWVWLKNGFWTMCCERGLDQPFRQIGSGLERLRQMWHLLKRAWPVRMRRAVVAGSYTSLFAVSLSPIPGIRGPAVIICGVNGLRWGLLLVILGNLIRNLYLIVGTSWLIG